MKLHDSDRLFSKGNLTIINNHMDENVILGKIALTTVQIALSFTLCNFPVANQITNFNPGSVFGANY